MELDDIRKEIDKTDEVILESFLKRMELSREVAEQKAKNGLPIRNRTRERQILSSVQAKSGEMEIYSYRLFNTLFELSRSYQATLNDVQGTISGIIDRSLLPVDTIFPQTGTVACQGVEGSYSQIAADSMFRRGTPVFFKNFEGVFGAVESGMCEYGILPIENSSNGSVKQVYELLRTRNVNIIRAKRLFISHELLVKPGVKLEEITEIHSHEQALGQCSEFIKSLGDKVQLFAEPNTAMAAEAVSKSPERGAAAIGSSYCAELYGLEAVGKDIRNSDNNYTRFICISKEPKVYPGADRISLIATLEHRPGSLYEVLAAFSALGVNLIKLESSPIVGQNFEFRFFLEIEADVHDRRVRGMLTQLERTCSELRYLGNYKED